LYHHQHLHTDGHRFPSRTKKPRQQAHHWRGVTAVSDRRFFTAAKKELLPLTKPVFYANSNSSSYDRWIVPIPSKPAQILHYAFIVLPSRPKPPYSPKAVEYPTFLQISGDLSIRRQHLQYAH
jgi:hypothetical protein